MYLFLKLLLRVPDDVNVFEWHPSIAGTIIGGCMNGQIVIWDITEYVSKFKRNKCVWKHSVVMSKYAKKLHVEDGFIPILYWSAESNVQVSHQSPVEDMKWLPKNVWVNLFFMGKIFTLQFLVLKDLETWNQKRSLSFLSLWGY